MTGFAAVAVAHDDDQADDVRQWRGTAFVRGPTVLQLPFLSLGLFGISLFWSAEMTQASPYLLSLGVSKSAMSMVLMYTYENHARAGPISGLLVQPIVGILSDNCTSSWGRRSPYMLAGTLLSVLAMLLMGYTRDVASFFTTWDSPAHHTLSMILGVLSLWIVDFSINAIQAVDRALIVDVLPSSSQSSGNAWAAKMMGFGSVAGFFIGEVDLTDTLTFLGSRQLQKITCIVSFLLLLVHFLVFVTVQERVLLRSPSHHQRNTLMQEIREIIRNMLTLPRRIRQVCFIQLFAWIGWFPVLFYSTTYVGDLYESASQNPDDEEGTRLGSRALFYNSVVALIATFVLPAFIADSPSSHEPTRGEPLSGRSRWHIPSILTADLATLWTYSHALFFFCMMSTFITQSVAGATALLTVAGVSWAVTQWAPYSLLGEAILTETAQDDRPISIMLSDARREGVAHLTEPDSFLSPKDQGEGDDDESEDEHDHPPSHAQQNPLLGNGVARTSSFALNADDDLPLHEHHRELPPGNLASKAGIILGIHNIFIVIPQMIVTAVSSIIFAITGTSTPSEGGFTPMPDQNITTLTRDTDVASASTSGSSVAYVFRLGGFSAAVAFYLCWKLARELKRQYQMN